MDNGVSRHPSGDHQPEHLQSLARQRRLSLIGNPFEAQDHFFTLAKNDHTEVTSPPSSTSSEDADRHPDLRYRGRRSKNDDSSASDEEEAGQKSVDQIVAIIERRLEEKLETEDNEPDNESSAGPNPWMFAILFFLVVLFLCHTGAAVYCFTLKEPFEHPFTCWSSNCRRMAKWFKSFINESLDPCDDFYQFICHKHLIKKVPKKFNKSIPMTFIEGIPYKFKGNLKLGQFLRPTKSYPTNQLLPFYQSCIFQTRRNKKGYRPFVHLLARLKLLHPTTGSSRRPNVARRMARIFKLTNKMPFIEVYGTNENYILIGMGKPDKEIESTNPEFYAKTVKDVFKMLQNFLLIKDEEEIDMIVYLVMRFEAELVMMQGKGVNNKVFGFPSQMDKYVKIPKKMHPNYNERTASFAWEDLIDELFIREHPKEDPKPVILFNWVHSILRQSDRMYILSLEQHIRRTPWYILFRYFQWTLIKAFGFDLTEQLQGSMNTLFPEAGISPESRCFRAIFSNLNALAAERYIMDIKKFNKTDLQMRKLTEAIVSHLINLTRSLPASLQDPLIESFLTLNITTANTKEISEFIPIFYEGMNISDEKYFENLIMARVTKSTNDIKKMRRIWPFEKWPGGSYSLDLVTRTDTTDESSSRRYLNVPFGALFEPFIGNDLPVLDVGGYGFWIVGFYSVIYAMTDLLGRYSLGRQAIEPEETVRFQKIMETELLPRLDCIYQMQSTLELPNLPGKKLNPFSRNARLKNLADPIGVEVVWKLYEKIKNNRKVIPEYQLLPGLEHYSPEQLMYMAIAREACTTQAAELEKHMLKYGPTPFRLRMNGAFRMQPHFAKTWKCRRNQFMNPKTKCQFFAPVKHHRTL